MHFVFLLSAQSTHFLALTRTLDIVCIALLEKRRRTSRMEANLSEFFRTKTIIRALWRMGRIESTWEKIFTLGKQKYSIMTRKLRQDLNS